jgi:hypothetical protein
LGELSALDRINFDSCTNPEEREKVPLIELFEPSEVRRPEKSVLEGELGELFWAF